MEIKYPKYLKVRPYYPTFIDIFLKVVMLVASMLLVSESFVSRDAVSEHIVNDMFADTKVVKDEEFLSKCEITDSEIKVKYQTLHKNIEYTFVPTEDEEEKEWYKGLKILGVQESEATENSVFKITYDIGKFKKDIPIFRYILGNAEYYVPYIEHKGVLYSNTIKYDDFVKDYTLNATMLKVRSASVVFLFGVIALIISITALYTIVLRRRVHYLYTKQEDKNSLLVQLLANRVYEEADKGNDIVAETNTDTVNEGEETTSTEASDEVI